MDSSITLASAGSGKTTMVVHLIQELMEKKVPQEKILVISYTKNAVEEIINRIPWAESINFHTFHSFCLEFLTQNNIIGAIQILDKRPPITFLPKDSPWEPWEVNGFLGKFSQEALFYSYYNEENFKTNDPLDNLDGQWQFIVQMVQVIEFLKNKLNLWVFSDLVITMYQLLQGKNQINYLWILYNQYDYIFIDECQDFSPMQLDIIATLFKEFIYNNQAIPIPKKFFIFGDTKQSIFNFQGANLDHFRHVTQKLHQLSQQYHYPLATKNIYYTHRLPINHIHFINGLFNHMPLEDFEPHQTQSLISGQVFCSFPSMGDTNEVLIKKIGNTIELLLESHKPEDIMIIFRNRDQLIYNLSQWLKDKNYSSGLDIINMTWNAMVNIINDINKFLEKKIDILGLVGYWIPLLKEEEVQWVLKHWDPESLEKFFKNHPIVGGFFQWVSSKNSIFSSYDLTYHFVTSPWWNHLIDNKEIMFNVLESSRTFYGPWSRFVQWLPSTFKSENYGVAMETIYGAKGLQSKIVMVVDGHKGPIGGQWQYPYLYESIDGSQKFIDQNDKNQWLKNNYNNIFKEFLRLNYVATTRSKELLYIFGAYLYENNSLLWYCKEYKKDIPYHNL